MPTPSTASTSLTIALGRMEGRGGGGLGGGGAGGRMPSACTSMERGAWGMLLHRETHLPQPNGSMPPPSVKPTCASGQRSAAALARKHRRVHARRTQMCGLQLAQCKVTAHSPHTQPKRLHHGFFLTGVLPRPQPSTMHGAWCMGGSLPYASRRSTTCAAALLRHPSPCRHAQAAVPAGMHMLAWPAHRLSTARQQQPVARRCCRTHRTRCRL